MKKANHSAIILFVFNIIIVIDSNTVALYPTEYAENQMQNQTINVACSVLHAAPFIFRAYNVCMVGLLQNNSDLNCRIHFVSNKMYSEKKTDQTLQNESWKRKKKSKSQILTFISGSFLSHRHFHNPCLLCRPFLFFCSISRILQSHSNVIHFNRRLNGFNSQFRNWSFVSLCELLFIRDVTGERDRGQWIPDSPY